MRKLWCKYVVPHILTRDKKQQHMYDLKCFELLKRTKYDFFRRIETVGKKNKI